MRRASLTLLLVLVLAGLPARAEMRDPGREFGLAVGSVAADLFYTPPKLLLAMLGLPAGAFTAAVTGCDLRSTYAVWVPTLTGTYFLTPAHLEGMRPIEFFGSHYPASVSAAIDEEMRGTRTPYWGWDTSR